MSTKPDLRTAAQAVIDRWDTPKWKDAPATAGYIDALRDALAADHTEHHLEMAGRWYMVNRDGMATLCEDQADASGAHRVASMRSKRRHLQSHRSPAMTLKYDIARCPGRITNRPLGSIAGIRVTSNAGHSECVRCRRREPGHPDHQTHMEPPVFVGGKCPMRIEP